MLELGSVLLRVLGRCDPADLIDETKDQLPARAPPSVHQPQSVPKTEHYQDPHTGIVWEGRPPRGDVPSHGHFLDSSEGRAQDQPHHPQGKRLLVGRNSHRVSLTGFPYVLCPVQTFLVQQHKPIHY